MNEELEREMLSYYEERAQEHDEVYRGGGPAIEECANDYVKDVAEISELASEFGSGHLIDVGCGPGFWAPCYASNCSEITFVDQSEAMLAECRNRVAQIGLSRSAQFVHGNFFDLDLGSNQFDSALVGFLLSHLGPEREDACIRKLGELLRRSSELMIIDSLWNDKRRQYRQKEGVEERELEDGRKFHVYKKYFSRSEIEHALEEHGFAIETVYAGELLIAAIAQRAS